MCDYSTRRRKGNPFADLILKMAKNRDLSFHSQILEKAKACFEGDERITGAYLLGSMATRTADFYSDVDFSVVVKDDYFDEVFAERNRVATEIGNPVFCFLSVVDPYTYIVLYDNMVVLNLGYKRESKVRPSPKYASAVPLIDKHGVIADLVQRSKEISVQTSRDELETLFNQFWVCVWVTLGRLARGELWDAIYGVETIRQLVVKAIAISQNKIYFGYKRLEKSITERQNQLLRKTTCNYNEKEIREALMNEISMFRELEAQLAERFSLTINKNARARITNLIYLSKK